MAWNSTHYNTFSITLFYCIFLGTAEDLKEYFFKIEVVKNDDDDDDYIKNKNKMREKIESSFQSITVIPFTNYKDENMRKDFKDQVEKLNDEITKEVSKPHSFLPLTPQNINDSMKDIMEKVQNNNCLDVDSIVETMQQKIIDKAYEDFQENFLKKYNEITNTESAKLTETLQKIKNDLVRKFNKKTKKMYLKLDYRDKVKEKIDEFFQEKLSVKMKKIQGTYICDGLNVMIHVI